MKTTIIVLALGLAAAPALAEPAPPEPIDCMVINLGPTIVEGRLTRHVFPGPPNYADVRRGDAAESAYILTLPADICIDDGGRQADPEQRFRDVQVYANNAALRRALRAAIGRRVRVTGDGFAAHTAHHRAPLVVEARRVTPLR